MVDTLEDDLVFLSAFRDNRKALGKGLVLQTPQGICRAVK